MQGKTTCENMMMKNATVWLWVQNKRLLKAISNRNTGTLVIYDEHDNILLRRTGLTHQQVKKIEICLASSRVKKIDENQEPFTYL